MGLYEMVFTIYIVSKGAYRVPESAWRWPGQRVTADQIPAVVQQLLTYLETVSILDADHRWPGYSCRKMTEVHVAASQGKFPIWVENGLWSASATCEEILQKSASLNALFGEAKETLHEEIREAIRLGQHAATLMAK
ncbi:MAG: hypothetical protein Q7R39_04520 [Dehalococcoidia bacterium]|nr:hypothetical protein [Dehalococcoidia bacterium]